MKIKIFAFTVFFAVLLLVGINTYYLGMTIDSVLAELEKIEPDICTEDELYEAGIALYTEFNRLEPYISLTVSHSDLMSIEDAINEFKGYAEVGDRDGASVTKSRLIGALRHLRRLSGFNIDSII